MAQFKRESRVEGGCDVPSSRCVVWLDDVTSSLDPTLSRSKIWYRTSWLGSKFPPWRENEADVSSASPSSERIQDLYWQQFFYLKLSSCLNMSESSSLIIIIIIIIIIIYASFLCVRLFPDVSFLMFVDWWHHFSRHYRKCTKIISRLY